MKRVRSFAMFLLLCGALAPLQAHHNTQAEYGPFDSSFITVDGVIRSVKWGNPHVAMSVEVTGGDLPAEEMGQRWQVNSHPINVMISYGFSQDEFKEGDRVHMLAWTHVRGIKHIWPRAIQVNDGPLKSNVRYTDMIDIANGTFEALGIQPAANLHGSDPIRAGSATVEKLKAKGLLDADGNMIWPAP